VCVCVLFRCGSRTCSVHALHASPFPRAPVFSMGFPCLQDLYMKKPCPHPGAPVWTNCPLPIFLYPCFGILTGFLQTFPILFYFILQTFSESFTPLHLLMDMDLSHQYRLFPNPFPAHLHTDMDLSHRYELAFFSLLALFPSLLTLPTM